MIVTFINIHEITQEALTKSLIKIEILNFLNSIF